MTFAATILKVRSVQVLIEKCTLLSEFIESLAKFRSCLCVYLSKPASFGIINEPNFFEHNAIKTELIKHYENAILRGLSIKTNGGQNNILMLYHKLLRYRWKDLPEWNSLFLIFFQLQTIQMVSADAIFVQWRARSKQ